MYWTKKLTLVIILKPFSSPFMVGCPPLWHLGKLWGTSYLPRGHFSNMLVSAMQRLFFDVKLATPTWIRPFWCKKGCLILHSTMEFWILVWYEKITSGYFSWLEVVCILWLENKTSNYVHIRPFNLHPEKWFDGYLVKSTR